MNLTQENLPPSSISVFLTGFVAEQVQNENNLFKFIKLAVTEFVGSVNTGKKFLIKCRYLKSDERINKKMMKTRKNSSVLITGELISVESEFQVDIQDMNFLSTSVSVSNIESATASTNVSSLYSWSATNQNSGRISAQAMALLNERANVNKNLTETLTDTQSLSSEDENLTTASPNNQTSSTNEDDTSNNLNNNKNNRRGRKRSRK